MEVKVHKVEVLIVDHDNLGAEGVKEILENTRFANRCILPHVMDIDTRTVNWSDKHPLNHKRKQKRAYENLFGLNDF